MHNEFFLFFRALASIVFAAILFAGVYLVKNHARFFGVDPSMPSENASARTYTKVLVGAIWVHLLAFAAAAALFIG